ncbi:MAG: hypothetical protein K2W82_08800 [Candidatus Obscuribacterales bacterium]|nr:hypothetical protein [Candidatus Obscuribacterales bacterium]
MRTFQFQTLGAAILFTVLGMGIIGVLVVLPVTFIQWSWNYFVPPFSVLPPINIWQAMLLYAAAAAMLYISGIVRVEIETGTVD